MVLVPVAVPFFQSKGLTMRDVFTLQALFAGVVLLAEVPSGYMADLFGRRRVLLVGALFCGLGHSLLLIAEGFGRSRFMSCSWASLFFGLWLRLRCCMTRN